MERSSPAVPFIPPLHHTSSSPSLSLSLSPPSLPLPLSPVITSSACRPTACWFKVCLHFRGERDLMGVYREQCVCLCVCRLQQMSHTAFKTSWDVIKHKEMSRNPVFGVVVVLVCCLGTFVFPSCLPGACWDILPTSCLLLPNPVPWGRVGRGTTLTLTSRGSSCSSSAAAGQCVVRLFVSDFPGIIVPSDHRSSSSSSSSLFLESASAFPLHFQLNSSVPIYWFLISQTLWVIYLAACKTQLTGQRESSYICIITVRSGFLTVK